MSSILQTSIASCSALLMLAACAANNGAASSTNAARSQGAEPAFVQSNFEDGVVEACGQYFLSDLDIQKTSKDTKLNLSKLRTGSQYPGGIVTGMPVYAASDGVVHIKENLIGRACEVFAYGIPVDATFDSIATRLTANGYDELDRPAEMPSSARSRAFKKAVKNDLLLFVILSGTEPGDPGTLSRFSTLSATIRVSETKEKNNG